MRIFDVTNDRDVTRLCSVVTLGTVSFVILASMLLNPRALWPLEFLFNVPITVLLTYGVMRVLSRQLLKVHDLNAELRRMVNRDRLTNAATRDFFFATLAERRWIDGVTLMVDVDHFKQVNDTHGHLAGDKVIAHVAELITAEIGARDIVCRFGGEEFVVFLENAAPGIARELAERFRERVASTPADGDGARIAVTLSVGGSLRLPAAEIDEAIRQADRALYMAKAMGRNRTVMSMELLDPPQGGRETPERPAA